ncbi:MAG TPA: hypothetical protein VFQ36_00260 [Ktedonobacteraceae bacterium]|nr:hypothetical protein [Ktedonobacteraceae bacterium]
MAKQWDSLIKLLVEANKQDLVSLLLPGAMFERELNTEMQSRVLEADLLYVVNWNGVEVVMHVEFQKRRDGNMGRRLWEYNAQATIISGLPVCSFVIYLQRDGNVVESPYDIARPNGRAIHLFFFDTVKIWEIPGDFLKQEGIEGLLPLLPLMQDGVHHEVVNDMIVSLNNAGKSDLLPLAYAFASLVFKSTEDSDWLRRRFAMLSDDIFEDAWAYQEMLAKGMEKGLQKGMEQGLEKGMEKGMEKGKIQGQREIIMDIVQERFPQISALVSKQVQKIEDPIQLRRLSVKLSTAQTVQEAEQALSSSSPNGQQH